MPLSYKQRVTLTSAIPETAHLKPLRVWPGFVEWKGLVLIRLAAEKPFDFNSLQNNPGQHVLDP